MPKVLAWNGNAENEVGSEYIMMQEASGIKLLHEWDGVHPADKVQIIMIFSVFGEIATDVFHRVYFSVISSDD